MQERMKVCDPLSIELPDPGAPRLLFVASDNPPQRGTVEPLGSNAVAHHFPWFSELILRLQDRSGVPSDLHLCLYRIPITDDVDLHAACIDAAPELLIKILGGADHGDTMSLLVAKHWPDVYSMLEASTSGDLTRRALIAFDTSHGRQWLVADPVVGAARGWFKPEELGALGLDAIELALRMNDVLTTLPEILELGPDLLTRRLRAWGGVLSNAGGLGDAAMDFAGGGLTVDGIRSLMEAATHLPDQLHGIRERRMP